MTEALNWMRDTFDHADAATVLGAVLGAAIAALVAVLAYIGQQRQQRRQTRAQLYAEALRSVEDYLEAPYRVRRRDGSSGARARVTDHVSNVQSRISYYGGLLTISASPTVSDAFEAFVTAARREAGPQMTRAWQAKATKKDRDVPIRVKLPQPESDAARVLLLAAMKQDLRRRRQRQT